MSGPTRHTGPSELFVVAVLIMFTVMGGAVALGGGLMQLHAPASAGPGQGPAIVGCREVARLATELRRQHRAEDSGEGEAP
jgi:hypothetical protein